MLPKTFRVAKEKDINRFFGLSFKKNKGRSLASKSLLIKILPNKFSYSRFGFIVNTKVDNRASVRNLVKRRLREIARLNQAKIRAGQDYLILAFPPAKNLDFRQMEKDFFSLLKALRELS